ncbi:MAG TPA: SMI1/KNR4 family protein [Pirellulaceae bacterium]|nr:SMI1/KNR4 family protein [Pirellulaceae bacterium]
MKRKSIPELIAMSDIAELASRYSRRYSSKPSLDCLRLVHDLITDPHGPLLGGTNESPWSDETWLNWIHNRLMDLESRPLEKVRERFVTPTPPTPDSIETWREFLAAYRLLAARVAGMEQWPQPRKDGSSYRPATEQALEGTENRLGVRFPSSLREFYLVTNGWPADGWIHPAINPLDSLNYLESHERGLYALADEAERYAGPFNDDPDRSRLNDYRFQQGTRVKRSIALNFDTDDTGTVLVDPIVENGTEWPCGSWAHFNPAMEWSHRSFSEYMCARYNFLLSMEIEHEG